MADQDIIVADMYSYHKTIDPALISTAGQYFVVTQLTRSLTQRDKLGQLVGDLAKSWSANRQFTQFSFQINDSAKFSDGSMITSDDVIATIRRCIKLDMSNHFNFNSIKTLTKINSRSFSITLKEPNSRFIETTLYPEFGVLPKNEANKPLGDIDWSIVSGPYYLTKVKSLSRAFEMKVNKHYNMLNPRSPSRVTIQFSEPKDKIAQLKSGSIDFNVSVSSIPKKDYNDIMNTNKYTISRPNLSYSFWVAINPESPHFTRKEQRNYIQKILAPQNYKIPLVEPFWTRANQLYLPDGLGRPSQENLTAFWNSINQVPDIRLPIKLSLLVAPNFPYKESLTKHLKSHGVDTDVTECKTAQDHFDLTNKKRYDLTIVRNDFSSVDLSGNMQTTFNRAHPLIYTDQKDDGYQNLLNKALNSDEPQRKHAIYQQIAIDVLQKGYIVPLAYFNMIYIHKKSLKLSNWSMIIPEISFWKAYYER